MPAVSRSLLVLLAVGAGCRQEEAATPRFSPASSAAEAVKSCDANQDQLLDAAELESAPGLAALLKTGDKNRDGKLSASEIRERIAQFTSDNVAYFPVRFEVLLDNRPLAGAMITLSPEPCLGNIVSSAEGSTNEQGLAAPLTSRTDFGGAQCGLYRIRVSQRDSSGKEQVPLQYNEKTTLGLELSLGNREVERRIVLRLSSSSAR